MTERYRVPKRKVGVELRLPRLGSAPASLFLSDRAASHGGSERPSDLFNGCDFLPVENQRGRVVFLRCDGVAVVDVPAEEELDKELVSEEALVTRIETRVPVVVKLDDGSVLEGSVQYELPEARSRLQDFLNLKSRFATLHAGERVLLVNKRFIAYVAEI